MYYNTNHIQGAKLNKAQSKTNTQEAYILKLFDLYPHGLTAWECIEIIEFRKGSKISHSSVRRAITNLKNDGFLKKTTEKRTAESGSPNYVYRKR